MIVRAMAEGGTEDAAVLAEPLEGDSQLSTRRSAADRYAVVFLAKEKLLASWETDVARAAVPLLMGDVSRDPDALKPFSDELQNQAATSNQSLFKRALEAFPIDKDDMQIDDPVLCVVFRIMFGKLSRRLKGLDKRGNIHTRQTLIFGYLGQVAEENMWLLAAVFLQGLVGRSLSVDWQQVRITNWSPAKNSFMLDWSAADCALIKNDCRRANKLSVRRVSGANAEWRANKDADYFPESGRSHCFHFCSVLLLVGIVRRPNIWLTTSGSLAAIRHLLLCSSVS